MPGRLFLLCSATEVAAVLDAPAIETDAGGPRRNITPGEDVLALGPDGLQIFRWGIIPVGRKNARGRPVMETIINARSETVFDKSAFDGVGRAVLPVSGWYEWTGEKRRKTAWELTCKTGELLFFAAITDVWQAPGGKTLNQLATVTCAPNADVAPIHHRMGVILSRDNVDVWINGTQEDAARLMRPLAEGLLHIRQADPGWFR